MAIQTLFPTYLYQASLTTASSLTKINRDILREAAILREIDDEGRDWSAANYVGGYTSYASMNELHKQATTFEELRRHLDRHVKKFAGHLHMDLQGGHLQMSNCWINLMPKGSHHSGHIHPQSVISGTYYVQLPRGSSAIKFEDPRLGMMMAAPPQTTQVKRRDQRHYAVRPRPGQVILFESWLRHEVPANLANQDRVSISFNYDWPRYAVPFGIHTGSRNSLKQQGSYRS